MQAVIERGKDHLGCESFEVQIKICSVKAKVVCRYRAVSGRGFR